MKGSNPVRSYRIIQVSDIPDLFRIRIATWHNPLGASELPAMGITPASVAEQLRCGSHKGWLCEIHGEVVGFAIGNRTNGEMWVIAVLKEYEGMGIGRQLITSVETWLWDEGWNCIWLTTDLDPTFRAVGFYKQLGWQDWKLEKDRYMRKYRPS